MMPVRSFVRAGADRLAVVAGRNATTRILFGNPPKDFGLIGELVVELAENAVLAQLGGVFPNSGAFGTKAHTALEEAIEKNKSPWPGVEIDAEVYRYDGGGLAKKKRAKGSLGIDIVVSYEGRPVLGLDLKTGRGFSRKKLNAIHRRFGTSIVEIRAELF